LKKIYLDNNATTFLDPVIKNYLIEILANPIGNPSSYHFYGQQAKGLLSQARKTIAHYLKVKGEQIIFTSGGTEGADLCLQGFLEDKPSAHVITSNVEHPCVFETLEEFRKKGGGVSFLPVDGEGRVHPFEVKKAINPSTVLISIMAVNNETGVMNDIGAISEIARTAQVPLVVDGVAWLGKEKISCYPGISAMFFSGHKVHALQGTGFVYLKDKKKIKSRIKGGPQELGMRGGTENMLGILSLAEAVRLLEEKEASMLAHIKSLRDHFESELLRLPSVSLNGRGNRAVNTSNLTFDKWDGEALLMELDAKGIAASLGSACASGALEPSRVLINMGLSQEKARRSLRFSLSRLNTFEEIEQAVNIIKRMCQESHRQ
jgi:cysteine desulfurase